MSYFAGRSYTSTLFAGSNYSFGLLAVAIVLWLKHDRQLLLRVVKQRIDIFCVLPLFCLSIFGFIGTFTMMRMDAVNVFKHAGTVWTEESERSTTLRFISEKIDSSEDLTDGSDLVIGQILPLSNILELETGIDAALIVARPDYLSLSMTMRIAQCGFIRDADYDIIIEERDIYPDDPNRNGSLLELPLCPGKIAFEEIFTTDPESRLRVLKVLRGN